MTTYEGGVRVPAMARWPGKIPAGTKLNGIQGHQDLFTTLAAAAGVPDVAARVMEEKKQVIDGVNNLDYWMDKSDKSSRDHIFHYYESKLTAVRMGPWKFHFSTKEDYYANVIPRTVPLVFNIRMDPYESYDNVAADIIATTMFSPAGGRRGTSRWNTIRPGSTADTAMRCALGSR
jgi:arylsulfatase A-like enzyme